MVRVSECSSYRGFELSGFELANVRVIGGSRYRGRFCMKIVLSVQGEFKISLT